MGTHAVRLTAVGKRFVGTPALQHVDLHIDTGEFVAVLGRSGSGKSTLLRVLAGLETVSSGRVDWGAQGGRPRTGVVFQQPLLMPWLTVAQNVAFAKRFAAHRNDFDDGDVADLMTRFGVSTLAHRYPDQLSGGQAQRVSILRAVATAPRLLLLDEPFSALDPGTRGELQQWLADLADELDVTVVLVTHDVDEALALADRIVLLDDGRLTGSWQLAGATADERTSYRRDVLDSYTVRAAR
jgi:sulfate transport system ATP-binding protein